MAIDYTVIGQRIKQARLAKNLTQEDLAEQDRKSTRLNSSHIH